MADETSIDIDTFISLVEERPILWDKNMDLYKNRQATQMAWDEITMAINPTLQTALEKQAFEILLRKKWRYLRDQFAVELAKLNTSSEGSYTPKWPPFNSLMFLKGIVQLRKFRSRKKVRRPSSTSVEPIDDSVDVTHISYQMEDDLYDPLEEDEDEKPPEKIFKYSTSNIPKFKTRKREYIQERSKEEDNEEHMYFFKSLLPHVREIPRRHLLSFRSRIQEIVEEFAYNTATHSTAN